MFFAIMAGLTAKAVGALAVRTATVVGTTAIIKKIINTTPKKGSDNSVKSRK